MSISKQIAALVLAVTTATTVLAEPRCPGNVESLPYLQLNRHQIVVPVSINHSGPYNFLLDTGTQMTGSIRRWRWSFTWPEPAKPW